MTNFNIIINKQIAISAEPTGNVTTHKWFIDNVEQIGESGPTIYRTYTILGETHTIRHEGNNDCGICSPASIEHTITVIDSPTPPVAEAGMSPILIGALAVGALVIMMSKKKQ
jgi:hypothetical protein